MKWNSTLTTHSKNGFYDSIKTGLRTGTRMVLMTGRRQGKSQVMRQYQNRQYGHIKKISDTSCQSLVGSNGKIILITGDGTTDWFNETDFLISIYRPEITTAEVVFLYDRDNKEFSMLKNRHTTTYDWIFAQQFFDFDIEQVGDIPNLATFSSDADEMYFKMKYQN